MTHASWWVGLRRAGAVYDPCEFNTSAREASYGGVPMPTFPLGPEEIAGDNSQYRW